MRALFTKHLRIFKVIVGLGLASLALKASAQNDGDVWHHEMHHFDEDGWLSVDYQLGGLYNAFEMRHAWVNAGGPPLSAQDAVEANLLCEWRPRLGRIDDVSSHALSLHYDARERKFTSPLGDMAIIWEGRTGARAQRLCAIELFVNGKQVLGTDFVSFAR